MLNNSFIELPGSKLKILVQTKIPFDYLTYAYRGTHKAQSAGSRESF